MMLFSSFCSRIFSAISTHLDLSINPLLEENEFINNRGVNNLQASDFFFLFLFFCFHGFVSLRGVQLLSCFYCMTLGDLYSFSIEDETLFFHFISSFFSYNLLSYLFFVIRFLIFQCTVYKLVLGKKSCYLSELINLGVNFKLAEIQALKLVKHFIYKGFNRKFHQHEITPIFIHDHSVVWTEIANILPKHIAN